MCLFITDRTTHNGQVNVLTIEGNCNFNSVYGVIKVKMFSGHMLLLLTWLSGPKTPPAVNSGTLTTSLPCKPHHTTQFSNNDAIKIQPLRLFPLLTVSTVLYKAGNCTDSVVKCLKVGV